jgi:hypothetical protein
MKVAFSSLTDGTNQGAQYLMGENLRVVWTEFSTLS